MNIFWNYTLHWSGFNINLRQFLGRVFYIVYFPNFQSSSKHHSKSKYTPKRSLGL